MGIISKLWHFFYFLIKLKQHISNICWKYHDQKYEIQLSDTLLHPQKPLTSKNSLKTRTLYITNISLIYSMYLLEMCIHLYIIVAEVKDQTIYLNNQCFCQPYVMVQ